jgi:DNA polymerase Ligase (LigD)
MPRYVMLRHDCPPGYPRPTHWDLMLQRGDSLRTWALPSEPADGASMTAEMLAEHRLAYLDYEGPLTHDRGAVSRFDAGSYKTERESEAELVVRLEGARLVGRATLVRLDAPRPGAPQCWSFAFSADRPATSGTSGDNS